MAALLADDTPAGAVATGVAWRRCRRIIAESPARVNHSGAAPVSRRADSVQPESSVL